LAIYSPRHCITSCQKCWLTMSSKPKKGHHHLDIWHNLSRSLQLWIWRAFYQKVCLLVSRS
jgi:hypothetical protein